jgi:hypothetical protein
MAKASVVATKTANEMAEIKKQLETLTAMVEKLLETKEPKAKSAKTE